MSNFDIIHWKKNFKRLFCKNKNGFITFARNFCFSSLLRSRRKVKSIVKYQHRKAEISKDRKMGARATIIEVFGDEERYTYALYFWKAEIKLGILNHSGLWVFMKIVEIKAMWTEMNFMGFSVDIFIRILTNSWLILLKRTISIWENMLESILTVNDMHMYPNLAMTSPYSC